MAEFRIPEPRLPRAPERYSQQEEASFRAALLRQLREIRDLLQAINDELGDHTH